MTNYDYKKMRAHLGHELECISYGDKDDNISIECIDCMEVIFSEDRK